MTRGSRRLVWLPPTAVAGVVAVVLIGAFTSTSAQSSVALSHITAAQLQHGGVSLSAAQGTVPISQDQAVANALAQFSNMPVNEARLARVHDVNTSLDCDCWIIDMTPPVGSISLRARTLRTRRPHTTPHT